MSNDHQKKLAEFVDDITTPKVPWPNAATAFVAMKKRAAAEVQHVQHAETGLSDRAIGLMAHMVAEKFALQSEATICGFSKLASDEREHARFFLRKLASARGTDWLLPEVPANKLAAMKERSITIMHHLCDELGDDPMRFTVGGFINQDVGSLGKLASLDQAKEKRAHGAAVALARVKYQVKRKLAQSSAISGGTVRGPDPSGMRPRYEIRDGAPYTYHDAKDEGQPKASKKTAAKDGLKWHEKARGPVGVLGGAAVGSLTGAAIGRRLIKKVKHPVARAVIAGGTTMVGGVGGMAAGAVGAVRSLKSESKRKMIEPALRDGRRGILANLKKDPTNKALQKDLKSFDDALGKMNRRKTSALKVAKIVKLAAEAGMSVQDYVGAEQQANQQMGQNELGHVRQIAEQATQQAAALSERASQAEQQLQGVQQQLQQSQQQGQMAMQQASESEANAAEQANAKLRMKMKIDQMRQTLADLAAVNPQMDEAPGPEAGMPQPGAPPGPVQQQADAAQQAAQQPQTAEQAKQTQQAQTAQNKAQEQTQQAQQAQQGQMGAAQVPGAPAVAPATPPTV